MHSIARKRAKVKKKASKTRKKKAVSKKTVKKRVVSKKTTKRKVKPKASATTKPALSKKKARRVVQSESSRGKPKKKVKTKAVRKVSKRKHKRRAVVRKKKRGVMRDWIDKTLSTPMATAQLLERFATKMPGIFMPNWVETDESIMMQRLIRAEQLGAFEDTARHLAMEFNWGLREVYELWHSPDVYF